MREKKTEGTKPIERKVKEIGGTMNEWQLKQLHPFR